MALIAKFLASLKPSPPAQEKVHDTEMSALISQAQEMQVQLMETQERLESMRFDGQSGGGLVKVSMDGKRRIISLSISPSAIDPDDAEMLAELVIAAINLTVEEIEINHREELAKVTGGISVPGLF